MPENIVVVGIDDSASARTALRWAAQQARLTHASLEAIHVWGLPPSIGAQASFALPELLYSPDAQIDNEAAQPIRAIFAQVDPDPAWKLRLVPGEATSVLVEASKYAHLLVVGTREHVGLGRLVNGSVSHYCLNHAHCPVVAVPAAVETNDTTADGAAKQAASGASTG
jgi:nucleotide-binding universal stress UspA family protein